MRGPVRQADIKRLEHADPPTAWSRGTVLAAPESISTDSRVLGMTFWWTDRTTSLGARAPA